MSELNRIGQVLSRAAGRGFLALVRLLGLISAVNQLLIADHTNPVALVVSGFLLAGAQVSEPLILGLVDRLFAPVQHPQLKPPTSTEPRQ